MKKNLDFYVKRIPNFLNKNICNKTIKEIKKLKWSQHEFYDWDGGILRESKAAKTYKTINTLVDQGQLDEQKLNLFNNFLNNL